MNKVFKLLRSTVETQNAWLSRHKREPSVMEATIPLWVAVRGAAACGGMCNAACVVCVERARAALPRARRSRRAFRPARSGWTSSSTSAR